MPALWNQSNSDKSANVKRIPTKCEAEADNQVLEQVLPSIFSSNKIQHGGSHHIEIFIYGHNSIASA